MARQRMTPSEMMQVSECFSDQHGDIRQLPFFEEIDWVEIYTGLLTCNDEYVYCQLKRDMLAGMMSDMSGIL